jgi:hypothetical protein
MRFCKNDLWITVEIRNIILGKSGAIRADSPRPTELGMLFAFVREPYELPTAMSPG